MYDFAGFPAGCRICESSPSRVAWFWQIFMVEHAFRPLIPCVIGQCVARSSECSLCMLRGLDSSLRTPRCFDSRTRCTARLHALSRVTSGELWSPSRGRGNLRRRASDQLLTGLLSRGLPPSSALVRRGLRVAWVVLSCAGSSAVACGLQREGRTAGGHWCCIRAASTSRKACLGGEVGMTRRGTA